MINSIRIDGVLRERKSKALFTDDYSKIEIQCYDCGIWKKIKKIENDHITKKFKCASCKRKSNPTKKKKVAKKKVTKKKEKWKVTWPDNCPHKAFFGCKIMSQCQGCYYNPDKKIALMPKKGQDDDEKKTAKIHWFYGDKKYSEKALKLLEEIKLGKGLHKGGTRSHFKYSRKKDEEDEE